MRDWAILIGLTAALGLSACQGQEAKGDEPAVSTGAAEDEVAAPELSEEEAAAQAFEAAWEAAAPVTASDPRFGDDDDLSWPEPISGSFEFRRGQVIQLGTNLYALVSSGHAAGGGDGAPGALAIHYLRRVGEGFHRVDVTPLFMAGGEGGGEPPTFEVRADLMPAPVLVIAAGRGEQGRSCIVTDLVELTPSHPVARATDVPTRRAEAEGDDAWEGAFVAGRSGRDFGVQYSGASDARATWALTDVGTYRATNQPRLGGC